MFKLFAKKETAMGPEELRARLEEARRKKDAPAVARAYHAMGLHYMQAGDAARAMLYLGRCEAITDASDATFKKVGKAIREDCSNRMGQLEDAPLLTNQITAQVEEQAGLLEELQVRKWGLLTLARLVKVGERLAGLPGCQVLGELGRVTDLVLRSLYEPISKEEFIYLEDVCGQIYDLGDSIQLLDPDCQVPASGGAPLEALDLNGMLLLTELNLYLDSHLSFLNNGPGESDPEADLIPCALLPDYYLRTRDGALEDMPQIRAELERIQSDRQFLLSSPFRDDVTARVRTYQELDLLA